MRRFVYCKVVLTTSLVWVLVDVFLLLYFSECNKCDDRKDRSLLPALRGEFAPLLLHLIRSFKFSGVYNVVFPLSVLFTIYASGESLDLRHNVFRLTVRLSHFCERNNSIVAWVNFFIFLTNILLESRTNWLDTGGRRSEVKVSVARGHSIFMNMISQ